MGVNCGGQICASWCGAICRRALRWDTCCARSESLEAAWRAGRPVPEWRTLPLGGMRHVGNCSSHLLRNPRVLPYSRDRGRACAWCAQKWPLFLFQYLAALRSGCDHASCCRPPLPLPAAQLCPRPPVLLRHHSSLLFASFTWLQHCWGPCTGAGCSTPHWTLTQRESV